MFSFVKSATIIVGKQRTAFLKIDKGEDEKHETQTDHSGAVIGVHASGHDAHGSAGARRRQRFAVTDCVARDYDDA